MGELAPTVADSNPEEAGIREGEEATRVEDIDKAHVMAIAMDRSETQVIQNRDRAVESARRMVDAAANNDSQLYERERGLAEANLANAAAAMRGSRVHGEQAAQRYDEAQKLIEKANAVK